MGTWNVKLEFSYEKVYLQVDNLDLKFKGTLKKTLDRKINKSLEIW